MILLAFLFWAAAQSTDEHSLLAQIQAYDTQIATLTAQIDALDAKARSAAAAQAGDEAAATRASADLEAQQARTTRLVDATYRLERHGALRLLFGAESPWELRRRLTYLRMVLAANEAQRNDWSAAAKARADRMKAAEESRNVAATLRSELDQQRVSLQGERDHRVQLLHEIRGSPAKSAQAVVEVDQAREQVAQSMAIREGTVTAAATPGDTSSFRSAKGHLSRPVSGSPPR